MTSVKSVFKISAWKSKMQSVWYRILMANITDVVQVLRMYYGAERTNLETLNPKIVPKRIEGFHDLFYLFACHQANRGIIAQDFDEAAYLWKVINKARPRNILEIGRWLGGSTVLLCAAAAQYGGIVISVDAKVKAPEYAKDRLLEKHLHGLGLLNYELIVGFSYDFNPGKSIDLAFIDGDHSYEGVKKDVGNIMKYMSPKGNILIHDGCSTREFSTLHHGVEKLIGEITNHDNRCSVVKKIGSLVHLEWHNC